MKQINQTNRRFFRVTVCCLAALLLWSTHFGFVYGLSHFACAAPTPESDNIRWLIAIVSLVCLMALVIYTWQAENIMRLIRPASDQAGTNGFLVDVMRLLAVLAFFAISWAGASIFFLAPC